MAIDRPESPYRLGNRFEIMPIPMVADHCVTVAAGAVQFVVESRLLTDEILAETYGSGGAPSSGVHFDDGGACLHVCGSADGLEYLRFDCFEDEPHYHYIVQADQANVIVRIDENAVGDPTEFSLGCVEGRLPEMLRKAGAHALAAEVAADPDAVRHAIAEVRGLMERARRPVNA
jgi:hypothetical protein